MNWRREWKAVFLIVAVFLFFYYLPVNFLEKENPIIESLALARWYAREHVILCLLPAFLIAGAISVFVSQGAVMKYLGDKANKALAYAVASISGSVLAVCSCTILPLFAGIYRMGAGIGPASAFLYAGPAINVLAIILTARILGLQLGVARAIGAILFSIVIGLIMQLLFHKENSSSAQVVLPENEKKRSLGQNVIYFGLMIGILIFANWGYSDEVAGFWSIVYSSKWLITSILSFLLALVLVIWMQIKWRRMLIPVIAVIVVTIFFPGNPVIVYAVGLITLSIVLLKTEGEPENWITSSWYLARQIFPLLLAGVLISGLLLGRPDGEGLIPSRWIIYLVGGNSIGANLFASVVGAFMYFATLTEVPILQGLMNGGMGKGPALALLLAGPALSLPSMLVIKAIMGLKKTIVFILLVVIMATISGYFYGSFF